VPKLEILIAAQDIGSEEQLPKVARQSISQGVSGLMINQTKTEPNWMSTSKKLRILHFSESGISNSRNRALENAEGEILLITDEDVELMEGVQRPIEEAFEKNPEADIITFQTLNEKGLKRKNYSDDPFWHDIRTAMKVSSIEIALKRTSIIQNAIDFDSRFGIGGRFPTGCENVFLSDALNKGLRILYCPVAIASHPDESSGRKLFQNESVIKAKGAMLYRIFDWKAYFAAILFALKKRRETGLSLFKNIQILFSGIREFKKLDHGE
jgi:glycosyltransferase involved in cell wall biosynthesis